MRRFTTIIGVAVILSAWLVMSAGNAARSRARTSVASPDQLGRVTFPTSCSSVVQGTIEKGVALLHSFQYQQAEQVFTDASKQDSGCAMAYWGKAMSRYHQLWDFPDAETFEKGREDLDRARKIRATTDREREYIAAAATLYQDNSKLSHNDRRSAYSAAMMSLHAHYPNDTEASEFYALSLISLAMDRVDDLPNRRKAIAILDPILRNEPNSPGAAHYLIHAADTPELAPQGLEAARAYAKIAPDSSHALHMPSHIFVRLGLWQETIDSNIAASASAAKATEMHMSDAQYQTHAMDFLDYAYLQSGQEAKARKLVEEIRAVPGLSAEDASDQQAIFEARNAIELHQWKEAAALPVPAIKLAWQDTTYWARAIGKARSGDAAGARKDTEKLAECVAAREADQKQKGYTVPASEGTDLREAKAWLAYAEGKPGEAIALLRAAAERQESEHIDSMIMPAREMLADLLIELKRPSDALPEYKSVLDRAPNRFDALYGAARAAQLAGNASEAQKYFTRLVAISAPTADRPELQEARVHLAQN
jgi:hypothetical protein